MVSDEVLIGRLREFLSTSDLNTTTNAIVRRRLEEDFGVDLSDRKAFVREQVDVYLQRQMENGDGNEENEGPGGTDKGGEETVEGEETSSSDGESSSKTRSGETEAKKRGGFTKLCKLSPELQKFTGATELARTEVVKHMWKYIKEHNLQDPSNKRNIICDDTLRSLFCVESIDMFQMNKAMTKHIWPLDSNGAPSANSGSIEEQTREDGSRPKKKKLKKGREDQDVRKGKKKQKGPGNSALLSPTKLSDDLIKFLGTGESALPRSDVIKRIWDYIKLNDLQDPSDKRQIICDEKLKELFAVDTFCGFTMAKFLTAHFIKTEK